VLNARRQREVECQWEEERERAQEEQQQKEGEERNKLVTGLEWLREAGENAIARRDVRLPLCGICAFGYGEVGIASGSPVVSAGLGCPSTPRGVVTMSCGAAEREPSEFTTVVWALP
jgi:hypothetical protein